MANIVIASKDSPANIESAANQMLAAGGQALALNVDVSDQHAINQAVA